MRKILFGPAALALPLLLLAPCAPLAAQAAPGAAADTLSLEEAVRLALQQSPAIRSAEAQRSSGRSGRWATWGQLVPSLQLSTGLSQSEVMQRTATDPITGGIISLPDSLIEHRQTFGTAGQLDLSWTVFDGGRRIWGIRQAESRTRAADYGLDAARARVAANVTIAYLDALEAAALAQTRRAELERASELVRLAQGRFETGAAPQMDHLQARVAEGEAELALMDAESAAEGAMLALLEYVPSAQGEVVLAEPPMGELSSLPSEEELRVCAVERSPELASLRAQLSAARRGREANRLWLLPSVYVGATWVRSELGLTRDAITTDPRNEQAYYRIGLRWTPFDQPGQYLTDRQRANADFQTAQAQLDSRRASLTREVKVALDRLGRVQEQEERRRLNVELAELQREQATERYRLGAGSIVERFQAEALAREAERQAIIARYAALRSLAELERAGGIRVSRADGSWSCASGVD